MLSVRSTSMMMLAAALLLAACSNGQPASKSPSAASSAVASASASPKKDGPRHMMAFGPAGIFFHHVDDLGLDAAQQVKVDGLEKDLRDEKGSLRDEMKALHEEIVAGVKAGKIDMAKIEPKQAALDKAIEARRDKEGAALDGLHKVLTPTQRTALVAAIRAKMDKKKGPPPGMGAPGGKMHGMGIKRLTKALDLDDAQQKKVEAILPKDPPKMPDREEQKKRMDALLDAFVKNDFEAKKQELFTAKPPSFAAAHTRFLADLVPILKPEQREKLAAKMSQPPKGFGKGPKPAAPAPSDDDDDDD